MTNSANTSFLTTYNQFSAADALWIYWNSLRNAGPVPERRSVNPLHLGRMMDHIFICEWSAQMGPVFRVVGHQINVAMGQDLSALPLTCMCTQKIRRNVETYFKRVFHDPAILQMQLGLADITLMPLLDQNGDVTRAIGVFTYDLDVPLGLSCFDTFHVVDIDKIQQKTQTYDMGKQHPVQKHPHLRLV